ncbi:MAG: pimeloyl-ACP methyl ester carboxylesterase, partial [Ilumatobacter sp.]
TAGLRKVAVPTLIVHGLMDKLVLPSGGIATARAVPKSRLLMFPDMGHDLPVPRHAEIVAAIKRNTDAVGASQTV